MKVVVSILVGFCLAAASEAKSPTPVPVAIVEYGFDLSPELIATEVHPIYLRLKAKYGASLQGAALDTASATKNFKLLMADLKTRNSPGAADLVEKIATAGGIYRKNSRETNHARFQHSIHLATDGRIRERAS